MPFKILEQLSTWQNVHFWVNCPFKRGQCEFYLRLSSVHPRGLQLTSQLNFKCTWKELVWHKNIHIPHRLFPRSLESHFWLLFPSLSLLHRRHLTDGLVWGMRMCQMWASWLWNIDWSQVYLVSYSSLPTEKLEKLVRWILVDIRIL